MDYLIYSILALALAPLIYFFLQSYADMFQLFDRIVFLIVTGIVILFIVPDSFQMIGYWAVPVIVVGVFLPSFVEKTWTSLVDEAHFITVVVAIVGIALHGMIDGMAISHGINHAGHSHVHTDSLPLAIILHRLPAALFVFWLFYPKHGWRRPGFLLSVIGLFTIAGYFASDVVHLEFLDEGHWFWGGFQALVGGSLFHLSFHRHTQGDCEHDHSHSSGTTHSH